MSEKRFVCIDVGYGDDWYITDNGKRLSEMEIVDSLNELNQENKELRNELTFLNKVISFFADNPMTKYSSKNELLEEMKLLEKMGLI